MTRNTAAYEPGYLARFTATITSAVPEFDPVTNPIGHALAVELFAPAVDTIAMPVIEVPEVVVAMTDAPGGRTAGYLSWPELAIEARARAMAERARVLSEMVGGPATEMLGELVEMPMAVSEVEWYVATTEPDEDVDELDEQVRIAG